MAFRVDLKQFNHWIGRHRLLVWWLIWVPLFLLMVSLSVEHLKLTQAILGNDKLSLWYKVLNTTPIIILLRLVVLGFGLALLLICLFFPVLRVGSEGVSWNLESYEEVTKLAGEAAGEEVELIVGQEIRRWQQIQSWLPLEPGHFQPSVFLGEFLQMLHHIYFEDRIFLITHQENGIFSMGHPFLQFLTGTTIEARDNRQIEFVFFLGQEEWLIAVRTDQPEGYSDLDQAFFTTVGTVFVHALTETGLKALFPELSGFTAHPINPPPKGGIR